LNPDTWNTLAASFPGSHILQTWEWGQVKQDNGWEVIPYALDSRAAALVLKRSLRFRGLHTGLSVMYVPRGPLLDWSQPEIRQQVLTDLEALALTHRAIFLKIDPEVLLGRGIPASDDDSPDFLGGLIEKDLKQHGWFRSEEQIQFANTVWIDLHGSEQDWLDRMKQKTRYNIRLAERKGVNIRPASLDELPMFYRMYSETSVRDGFVIRPQAYYLDVWKRFMAAGMAEPLLAEVDGEPVAGLILFTYAGKAWYLYGMSRETHREKMPNYLLQWEAMKRARDRGCTVYDLWGAPDIFDESDSMWGVFRFKEGLGGKVIRTIGAWDFPVQQGRYALYTRTLPMLLNWMRRRGKATTRQEVSL